MFEQAALQKLAKTAPISPSCSGPELLREALRVMILYVRKPWRQKDPQPKHGVDSLGGFRYIYIYNYLKSFCWEGYYGLFSGAFKRK